MTWEIISSYNNCTKCFIYNSICTLLFGHIQYGKNTGIQQGPLETIVILINLNLLTDTYTTSVEDM